MWSVFVMITGHYRRRLINQLNGVLTINQTVNVDLIATLVAFSVVQKRLTDFLGIPIDEQASGMLIWPPQKLLRDAHLAPSSMGCSFGPPRTQLPTSKKLSLLWRLEVGFLSG